MSSCQKRKSSGWDIYSNLEDKLISKRMNKEFEQMNFFNKGANSYPRVEFWSDEIKKRSRFSLEVLKQRISLNMF
ncbi:MAG: hypothetical protein OXE77_02890 [Flavobacteriaceae bacterium]|nr:hypothetical protein [Flavobacteriaceae bacterium]